MVELSRTWPWCVYVCVGVCQGVLAKAKDMKAAFGTDDVDEVIRIILDKGELQVSGGERDAQQERCASLHESY